MQFSFGSCKNTVIPAVGISIRDVEGRQIKVNAKLLFSTDWKEKDCVCILIFKFV